jgi:hypothetical protein
MSFMLLKPQYWVTISNTFYFLGNTLYFFSNIILPKNILHNKINKLKTWPNNCNVLYIIKTILLN